MILKDILHIRIASIVHIHIFASYPCWCAKSSYKKASDTVEDPAAEMLKWVVNPIVIKVVGDTEVEDKVRIQSK